MTKSGDVTKEQQKSSASTRANKGKCILVLGWLIIIVAIIFSVQFMEIILPGLYSSGNCSDTCTPMFVPMQTKLGKNTPYKFKFIYYHIPAATFSEGFTVVDYNIFSNPVEKDTIKSYLLHLNEDKSIVTMLRRLFVGISRTFIPNTGNAEIHKISTPEDVFVIPQESIPNDIIPKFTERNLFWYTEGANSFVGISSDTLVDNLSISNLMKYAIQCSFAKGNPGRITYFEPDGDGRVISHLNALCAIAP